MKIFTIDIFRIRTYVLHTVLMVCTYVWSVVDYFIQCAIVFVGISFTYIYAVSLCSYVAGAEGPQISPQFKPPTYVCFCSLFPYTVNNMLNKNT